MPPRSKVAQLPDAVREELERRLIGSAFSGYEDHSAWLASKGYEIKKTALNNFGRDFQERCAALRLVTEQARVIVQEAPDDDNAVNDALIRLCQEKAYTVLMDMEVDPEQIDLPKLVRAIADIGRSSVQQKKFLAEARKAALKEAADRVEETARAQGMGEEQAKFWRERVLAGA